MREGRRDIIALSALHWRRVNRSVQTNGEEPRRCKSWVGRCGVGQNIAGISGGLGTDWEEARWTRCLWCEDERQALYKDKEIPMENGVTDGQWMAQDDDGSCDVRFWKCIDRIFHVISEIMWFILWTLWKWHINHKSYLVILLCPSLAATPSSWIMSCSSSWIVLVLQLVFTSVSTFF